ncbi:hypothetical protein LOK49_LG06G01110 [Camellia lanceoleosa]|uniref:Uncharacterized protein n=1 Tax=Camellia lanceoleosa TaxID=1840588 RepID=A0ACC0HGT4_9ERIC|nr:hypothetical protein LOK49_LG06G01110 [Camellia lanceoleosa]
MRMKCFFERSVVSAEHQADLRHTSSMKYHIRGERNLHVAAKQEADLRNRHYTVLAYIVASIENRQRLSHRILLHRLPESRAERCVRNRREASDDGTVPNTKITSHTVFFQQRAPLDT